MKQIITVCSYTFKEGVRKKTFLVSTAIIMALIVLLCLVPRVISLFSKDDQKNAENAKQTEVQQGEEQTEGEKKGICYFIDDTGIFEKNLNDFEVLYSNLNFIVSQKEDLEELKKDVGENEKNSLIYIQNQEGVPFVSVVNTNFMKGISAEKIARACDKLWQTELLEAEGVERSIIETSQIPLGYMEEAAGEMDLTGYILGLVMTFVMFFAVYYYGYGVAMSVASEKTSRVMETLIISAKPSRILIGKCLAMGALGLIQLGGLLVFGAACYSILMPDGFQIGGIDLSFSNFSPSTVLLLIVYFILGYALYAVINSVCGAAVSKVEDLNSAMMPVSIIAILGFYLGYFTSVAGGGSNALSQLAVYLPISSPFAVPFKILTGEIQTADLLLSLGILALTIVVVVILSSKVYSASVMHYGNRLKWKDLRKMKANK